LEAESQVNRLVGFEQAAFRRFTSGLDELDMEKNTPTEYHRSNEQIVLYAALHRHLCVDLTKSTILTISSADFGYKSPKVKPFLFCE
jgi:hypothetical protein